MLFYDTTTAPNPRRVRIFLAEKGIEVPTKQVDIMGGESRSPEYRAIASNGRVPCLQLDDGSVILETVAICRYFDAQKPEPNLFGEGQMETALVEMWNRRMELELMFPVAGYFRHTHPAMAVLENQVKEYGESMQKVVTRGLKTLNEQLSKNPYVAGERYTIADITTQCTVDFFLPVTKWQLNEDEHSAIIAWQEKVGSRPSAKA